MIPTVLRPKDSLATFTECGGGKAANLARLSQASFPVPEWFCVSSRAFDRFIEHNRLQKALLFAPDPKTFEKVAADIESLFLNSIIPIETENQIKGTLADLGLYDRFLAVRSSGLDEDSAENSFAGQFSSFLFQKGWDQVQRSIKRCWASGFSARALTYRLERGLSLRDIRVGIVIQKMVDAEVAGVAFSRNPIRPLDRNTLIISSVWGQGEGLVSGELDADHFEVQRESLAFHSTVTPKSFALRQAPAGGLERKDVSAADQLRPSLSPEQVQGLATLTLELEKRLGKPQDCEWAIERNQIFLVQTRPITTLPSDDYFNPNVNGDFSILWDNSNIIESYSGVTSPLTFSFASSAYRQVYIQFCELVGVPKETIQKNEPMFRNMLGLIRGRIYYNLVNWYKLVLLLPGSSNNKGFMETMMGVKQKLKPEHIRIFDEVAHPPTYSTFKKLYLGGMTLVRYLRINTIIDDFQSHFKSVYESHRKLPFQSMSLTDLAQTQQYLDEQILRRWQAPIINDYLCMIFFGVLKKITEKWVEKGDSGASLQNDLLCGQGDLESTEPTKMLMRIAERVDTGPEAFRSWIIQSKPQEIWHHLKNRTGPAAEHPEVSMMVEDFLDKYGFRCINELKLEESDLHDDPSFIISAVSSYVRMKSYSIAAMEEREKLIRDKAEGLVRERLTGWRRPVYFWVVRETRKAVRNRENLRFARTKIFGVARHLFRGVGTALTRLGFLSTPQDVFYLTVDEIIGFVEGRLPSLDLNGLVTLRKKEYDKYRNTLPPPDRLITTGAAGASFIHSQILADSDLLRSELPASTDPNVLVGTPCCPGVIEGVVRVVENVQDADGMNGEILVTARTDPGWVPLYPSCSGLLIERGSLLSHSAVVARELGLPTIVGISGGLMTRLQTGQRVRIDAGKGEVRILE